MPRFFIGTHADGYACITGEDARHIALSLRMHPGEEVTVCDTNGEDCRCVIESVSPEQIGLRVCVRTPCEAEPRVRVTLYQALPKGDKMEWIIQKAVELGVHRVVPVLTAHCVSRPDARTFEKKLVRYNRIAQEAAKQCGRGMLPEVAELCGFEQAIEQMRAYPRALFFYENADTPLHQLLADPLPDTLAVLVGSEGGFSPAEAAHATGAGLPAASLGKRILRCETAPLAALSAILYAAGEF